MARPSTRTMDFPGGAGSQFFPSQPRNVQGRGSAHERSKSDLAEHDSESGGQWPFPPARSEWMRAIGQYKSEVLSLPKSDTVFSMQPQEKGDINEIIHPVRFITDTSNFRLVCPLEFPYMVHATLLI